MRRTRIGVVLAAVLLAPALPFAQGMGGGGGGGPPEGVPPDEEEEAGNNLSVPTIFVPDASDFGLACPGGPVDPIGIPQTGFELNPTAYYYVQGEHTWQAECDAAAVDTVTATVKWGDNLTGDAPLKVGTPVRIEVRLVAASIAGSPPSTMLGYDVVKLEPSLLDRNSRYGTLATPVAETGGFTATQTSFPTATVGVGVYAEGATFSICRADDPAVCLVPAGTSMGSEINAGGAVLWGYLARFSGAGDYVITFTAPGVDLDGDSTVTQTITVRASAGGGKKPR